MTPHLAALSDRKLTAALRQCGLTAASARAVLQLRPFADDDALCTAVDTVLDQIADARLPRALAAVPEPAVERGDANARDAAVLALQLYRDRFGYPFVSAIDAPTAVELLMRVRIRLGNDPEPENRAAREHLRRIVRSRMQQIMDSGPSP